TLEQWAAVHMATLQNVKIALAGFVVPRKDARVADIIAIAPMPAGDDRELVPARAFLSRHYAIRGGGLRRPRNDAAGIVGVSAPAPAPSPAATPAAAIGLRAGGEKRNREECGEQDFATHR